jgi:hypothetical protein
MTTTILAAGILLLSSHIANAQEPPNSLTSPLALYDIGRALTWSHIGSPPSQRNPAARAEEWRRESASYRKAFDIIRSSWTGEDAKKPDDLRFKVRQYEDLVRTATESGGYGNILLADCLRRLSLALPVRYGLAHPSEYAAVGNILEQERVRLLDCGAIGDMLMEELRLAPPSGGWHLAESREELDLIFRSDGSSLTNEAGRVYCIWRFRRN